ncbi:retrotransposon-related protein [Tanacetum coccineum]
MFIVGLPATIELNVRIFRPKSLSDAFSLASLQEVTLAVIKQRNTPLLPTPRSDNNWNVNKNTNYAPENTTTTLALPILNTQAVNKYSASEAPVQKKLLSQKEFVKKELKTYVFTMPKELPPCRSFDHKIPHKIDNVSINIRPYIYPPTQKDTIKAMIKELLDSGVVRLSNSPFSSPIVMVKEWVRNCDNCQRNKSDLPATPDNVYKLHGLPKTIVSDRDKIFMSLFWQSLFKVLQVKLKMSTAYHSQTDGETEIVNKCLETYLRCMTEEKPEDWDSAVEAMDMKLIAREQTLQLLKFNLKKEQDRMKSHADKKRSDREFEVNVWVYLKLQPYRQFTVRWDRHHKLSSKNFGPFQIMKKIGKVAYKLQLPHYAMVHPVFHVS